MVYGGKPNPGTCCRVPDVGNMHLVWNIWCMGYILSALIRLPRMFLSTDFLFEYEKDKLRWTSVISNLHTTLRIISRGAISIKRCLTSIGIPMLKIRRSRDRLIFNMRIPIPGKDGLYIEMGPRSVPGLAKDSCSAWGRGWTHFPLYWGPYLGIGF